LFGQVLKLLSFVCGRGPAFIAVAFPMDVDGWYGVQRPIWNGR
jgi:hypothetical protein